MKQSERTNERTVAREGTSEQTIDIFEGTTETELVENEGRKRDGGRQERFYLAERERSFSLRRKVNTGK